MIRRNAAPDRLYHTNLGHLETAAAMQDSQSVLVLKHGQFRPAFIFHTEAHLILLSSIARADPARSVHKGAERMAGVNHSDRGPMRTSSWPELRRSRKTFAIQAPPWAGDRRAFGSLVRVPPQIWRWFMEPADANAAAVLPDLTYPWAPGAIHPLD